MEYLKKEYETPEICIEKFEPDGSDGYFCTSAVDDITIVGPGEPE